ncbi:MAG TPA: DUF4350 domain-containing protein [Puia sp.]|nr:DUF4350 domain-containing protein [Puia sp.]
MDKIPYGIKYSYDNLPFIFPNADIRTSNRFPVLFQNENGDDTPRALIIVGPEFRPDPDEMQDIIRFAASGRNQVFISALYFEDTVMAMLHLKIKEDIFFERDSSEISLLSPDKKQWINYNYPGYSSRSYFETIDTGYTMILGRDISGNSDFIRISYAKGGSIFIHLNPFAFTNFFLLHKNNRSYYDIALSNMQKQAGVVEWSDYFRYRKNRNNFSSLRFILVNRSLRWAFWLTLILFLLMFLIESKRKQRPIAVINAPRNASEDFVKTVGRLYFQQKNNRNLAAKMITAFLENIRTSYNLSTSLLDEEFVKRLAIRAGRPLNEIELMVRQIRDMQLKPVLSDQELMDLHSQISQFNKPT